MNGIHDMGGLTCFGPVEAEGDEPVFHHEWEKRVFALSVAMGGIFGPIDARRHMLERMDPIDYLRRSYYERWWARFEAAASANDLVSEEEVAGGERHPAPPGVPAAPDVETMVRIVQGGKPASRDSGRTSPRFQPGDPVRTRNVQPAGHTRLPRYARGRMGVIDRCHGTHVFPDSNAHGNGECPQPLYCVRFAATELWGPEAAQRDALYLDLWEDHLEGPHADA